MQRRLRPQPSARQRGTTLVEILVVLVILVLGILTILRIFPGGFLAVRAAENSTLADRLAQGTLETLKKNSASLPEGVYVSYTDQNGQNQFNPNIFPDDLSAYPGGTALGNANAANDPYSNDLNKARYISNETITVPAGRIVNNAQLPPLHVLNFGPIYLPPTIDPTANAASANQFATYLSVRGIPWTATVGDSREAIPQPSSGNANLRKIANDEPSDELEEGDAKFLVDNGAGKIAVSTASYPQVFTFTVQVPQNNGPPVAYRAVLTLPAKDPTNTSNDAIQDTNTHYNGGWFAPSDNALSYATASSPGPIPAGPWVPGSAVLERDFRCTFLGDAWNSGVYDTTKTKFDNDPYEYAIVNANFAGSGGPTSSNLGVLAFNPLAAGQNGRSPLKARMSYTTLDWHIIHEDRDVPSFGEGTIRLTLSHLKKVGDVQFNNTTFNGLIPGADPASAFDVMVLDLDTGQLIDTRSSVLLDTDANTGPGPIRVSYQAGRITLPSDLYGGKHVRVFYTGDADWAVAVEKAPSVYTRVSKDGAGNDNIVDLTKFVAEYAVPTTGTRIYFPNCDAGKTVELDGITYTDTTGTARQASSLTAPISDVKDANGQVYVDLAAPDNLAGYASNQNTQIEAVRGVSARAVVIWKERGNWRVRTVDTLLTRTQ